MTWILATLAALSKFEVPWKWIGASLAALAISLTIGLGYLHVQNLTRDLQTAQADLAKERVLEQAADARANAIAAEHAAQVERITTLEQQRSDIAIEIAGLRTTLQNLDIEQDLKSDDEAKADAAVGRLNARNAELNRLLAHASGAGNQIRTGARAGGKAGAAGAPGPLQRALQALRPAGVSDGH